MVKSPVNQTESSQLTFTCRLCRHVVDSHETLMWHDKEKHGPKRYCHIEGCNHSVPQSRLYQMRNHLSRHHRQASATMAKASAEQNKTPKQSEDGILNDLPSPPPIHLDMPVFPEHSQLPSALCKLFPTLEKQGSNVMMNTKPARSLSNDGTLVGKETATVVTTEDAHSSASCNRPGNKSMTSFDLLNDVIYDIVIA